MKEDLNTLDRIFFIVAPIIREIKGVIMDQWHNPGTFQTCLEK